MAVVSVATDRVITGARGPYPGIPLRDRRTLVPHIEVVPPSRATGETAEVYDALRRMSGAGMVAQVVQVFSQRPASMRRMIRSWELAMWMGSEPRAQRELIAAAVSRLNDCHY